MITKLPLWAKILGGFFILGIIGQFLPKDTSVNNDTSTKTEETEPSVAKNKKSTDDPTAYEMIPVAFEGRPKLSKVKPLLEAVMKQHDLPVNEKNLKGAASALIAMRKESVIGITEMEILKHMYQQGSPQLSFAEQAALSLTLLDKGLK